MKNELNLVTDEELLARIKALAQNERSATIEVIRHLREIEARGLAYDRGYSSLYDYAIKELGYSEGAAYRRIQAMRLIKDVPGAEQQIAEGTLSLNTAAKVQSVCQKHPEISKAELLTQVAGKPSKEVERELSPLQPDAKERARWVSPEAVELTVLLPKPTFDDLEEIKALKSHTGSTYSGVVKELVELGQLKWNPLRRTVPPLRGSAAQSTNSRYIPSAIRVEIWRRDRGRCTFVDPATKRKCESNQYMQIDHIQPVALGGKTTLENLRLLCGQHNRRRAGQTFGPRI